MSFENPEQSLTPKTEVISQSIETGVTAKPFLQDSIPVNIETAKSELATRKTELETTENQLAQLRADLGISAPAEEAPSITRQREQIQKLEETIGVVRTVPIEIFTTIEHKFSGSLLRQLFLMLLGAPQTKIIRTSSGYMFGGFLIPAGIVDRLETIQKSGVASFDALEKEMPDVFKELEATMAASVAELPNDQEKQLFLDAEIGEVPLGGASQSEVESAPDQRLLGQDATSVENMTHPGFGGQVIDESSETLPIT